MTYEEATPTHTNSTREPWSSTWTRWYRPSYYFIKERAQSPPSPFSPKNKSLRPLDGVRGSNICQLWHTTLHYSRKKGKEKTSILDNRQETIQDPGHRGSLLQLRETYSTAKSHLQGPGTKDLPKTEAGPGQQKTLNYSNYQNSNIYILFGC